MASLFKIEKRTLHFKRPATTSRGSYTTHAMYLIHCQDEAGRCIASGECAPLPDLSFDRQSYPDSETVERLLHEALASPNYREYLRPYPALCFALESALQLSNPSSPLLLTPFARGQEGIPMNGLVWMASYDEMLRQISDKIEQGFRCIKIKIGSIDFRQELALLESIRSSFTRSELEIRVDANGHFTPSEAEEVLSVLAKFEVHSIEQPIAAHQWRSMAELCRISPIPIALDEELIGVLQCAEKEKLLDTICPQYIVLKPTLHGGISGVQEWIALARERNIGSWITSALESNVGLQSIALLAALEYGPAVSFPQGLGTGELFVDNIPTPIHRRGSALWREISQKTTQQPTP